MATGATKESIRASEEQHKIANDDGGRVCEAPATAEDPGFRLVSEQDDSAVGEQDPSTKDLSTKDPSMASAAANDVDEAMEADEDSATASKAEVNEATLSSESSTMPDSVGDLFDDCAAVNSATQVFNEGESQEAQTAGPAISDGQHQPAEPVATETIEASESGENRLEPEDPDASVKEADATPSSSIVIANESANASDVSSTVEGPTETQPAAESSTVGVKRAAPSPTSALPAFSWNDILRVQNLIERCLQQYLTKVRATPGLLLLHDCITLTSSLSRFMFPARDLGGASNAGERRSLLRGRRVAEARGTEPVLLPRLPHPAAVEGADRCLQLPRHAAEGDECEASQAPARADVLCGSKEHKAAREHQQQHLLAGGIVQRFRLSLHQRSG